MSVPVITAADGASWESALLAEVAGGHHPFTVVRRCVDLVELLGVAAAGQARAALIDADLRRLSSDAVQRLVAGGVAVIAVLPPDPAAADRMRDLGIDHAVPADAGAAVIATVIDAAIADLAVVAGPSRSFADPGSSAVLHPAQLAVAAGTAAAPPRLGSVIAVWGPTGAPGRTTVAVGVADELARLAMQTLLIDADVYGGVVAAVLGLLDESPGVVAACRQAQAHRLDESALAALAWQVRPGMRVLTGIPRADRWPELKPTAMSALLSTARSMADFTVLDVGFALESDEELSYDTMAPRRNGATLAALDDADLILAVGTADPIGVQRLVRGLAELRDAEIAAPVWIVLNRVRRGPVAGDPAAELDAVLLRYCGQTAAARLPYDRAAVDAGLSAGRTLGEVAANSPLRRNLAELAAAIAGVPAAGRSRRRRHGAESA